MFCDWLAHRRCKLSWFGVTTQSGSDCHSFSCVTAEDSPPLKWRALLLGSRVRLSACGLNLKDPPVCQVSMFYLIESTMKVVSVLWQIKFSLNKGIQSKHRRKSWDVTEGLSDSPFSTTHLLSILHVTSSLYNKDGWWCHCHVHKPWAVLVFCCGSREHFKTLAKV